MSDLQKLLKYFNGTATVAFFRIPIQLFGVAYATVVSNNLALYLKHLKSSVFAILAFKLATSSLE